MKYCTLKFAISYLGDRLCSILSGAGKFCLAHGLRQLIRDTKNDSVVYKCALCAITKNAERRSELAVIQCFCKYYF